ncbi:MULTISPECIES: ScbR family autoregulator-binding transcription factor [unclassified Streptomyces]|uniref:ScbR family autoregulator-binding transcription factor n=1 Tax=unclassified Streptomyces TaxID=2593676 RepID=UPI003666C2D3
MASPKQDRAIRTKAEILEAAAAVFEEYGYAGASMRQIVHRAGVTLGAGYFHFEGKEALARAVMNNQPTVILPLLKSSALQRLVDITFVWAHLLQTNTMLRAGVRLAVEQRSHGIRDGSSFDDWEQIMIQCLEQARADGELRSGVECRDVAKFLVGCCTGMQLHSELTTGRADLPQRVVTMWRLLVPVLADPGAAEAIDLDTERGKRA